MLLSFGLVVGILAIPCALAAPLRDDSFTGLERRGQVSSSAGVQWEPSDALKDSLKAQAEAAQQRRLEQLARQGQQQEEQEKEVKVPPPPQNYPEWVPIVTSWSMAAQNLRQQLYELSPEDQKTVTDLAKKFISTGRKVLAIKDIPYRLPMSPSPGYISQTYDLVVLKARQVLQTTDRTVGPNGSVFTQDDLDQLDDMNRQVDEALLRGLANTI